MHLKEKVLIKSSLEKSVIEVTEKAKSCPYNAWSTTFNFN